MRLLDDLNSHERASPVESERMAPDAGVASIFIILNQPYEQPAEIPGGIPNRRAVSFHYTERRCSYLADPAMTFLYKSEPVRGELWRAQFARQMPACPFHIWPDMGNGADVRYLAAWMLPDDIPGLLPNLQAVFSTGAGIDQFDFSHIPAHAPVVRLIEPDLSAGIVEYAVHGVITAHRDMINYRNQQRGGVWR